MFGASVRSGRKTTTITSKMLFRLQLPMGKLCVGMHCLNEKSENHVPCANKMYLEKAVAKIRSIHHINRNDRK
ncbi:unnamed protein product [Rhizophagus irregularis]|uniref:Uncharacterized protein n=1 Tax=Rhizophagus irregularis TaxID=588596 RepID=A0A915ZEV0_9GLOM|nr:hypothetical protein RIR_jg9735.t1 [Rhizophagus irregularis DAOM 181602=DAOM 197198]CAB5373877.1 unnamed protein product [Rhizophagus irregularis]